MRKILFVLVGLMCLLYLSGCFNHEEKGDEMVDFMNGYMEIEDEFPLDRFFMSDLFNQSHAQEKKHIQDEVLPSFKKRIEYLEDVDLEYKAIKKLKELTMDRDKAAYEFFKDMLHTYEDGTLSEIDNVLEDMADEEKELSNKTDEMFEEFDKIMEKYDLYLITVYDDDGEELDRIGKDR